MTRIYVSSTYGDLKDYREQVYRALRQLGHDAVAMEDYVAADQRPLARCLADVAASDLYVGVFAHRYGYIPQEEGNPEGRSITELEYRHALAKGKPCLVFLLDEAAPWPPTWSDAFTGDGEGGRRIRALREELGHKYLVSFFATAEELAQKVSVAVTNQLKDQTVSGQPAVPSGRGWTIPPPVRTFVGRDDQLAALRAQLTSQGTATLVPTTALIGMAGVGKTQLALAYAQRYRGEYTLGWWVPAETEVGLVTALAELGTVLGLPERLPVAELAARTRDALGERSGWLLIFDYAPDPTAVAEFLPGAGGGHVLLTSRDSHWQGIADPVPVDLLSAEDAAELLVRRTGDLDREAAARLAEALGRLPLALEQAAAYTASQHLSLASYLELFAERREELLALGRPLAYQGTVDATFTLCLDELRATSPAAVQLLELCALLAADELPLPLLLSDPEHVLEPLATTAADSLHRGEVTGVLYQTGLLISDVSETARIHRLVQEVTLARLSEADRQQRIGEAVRLIAHLFPSDGDEPAWWPRCAQLLPHAQAVSDHARRLGVTSVDLARLLNNAGVYLFARALDFRRAQELHEQALAMFQQLYGGDHPEVAASLNNIAVAMAEQGKHKSALEVLERALAMFERLYEGDHPRVAATMSHLAGEVGTQAGQQERARALYEQALEMFQRLYEGDHPEVARVLNNLAAHLQRQGDNERARALDEQALAMRQRLYEGDRPDIAHNLNNLAGDLRALGDNERARALDEQALAMRQRLYDSDHPLVAMSLHNLAVDLQGLREYERAREFNKQALAMRQRLYDGDHPDVAWSLNNLAIDLSALGEHEQARRFDEQALAMRVRLYKGDHLDVAWSLHNLAIDLSALGEHERAQVFDEQALAMRQRLYDGDHPDVAWSLNNLAIDLSALGEHERAQAVYNEALAMRQRLAEGRLDP
jgi:tetratricopeptide (TPR) repeat protein